MPIKQAKPSDLRNGEEIMSLERQRIFWVLLFLIMVLSAFIVPFTPLLQKVARFQGAFLFWSLFAVIVIVCLGSITARWRDDDER
jgi:predicted MFS family arabinose efflux permease